MTTKQVLVVRRDLKMRRGKEIAQAAHAAMAFMTRRLHMMEWGGVRTGILHSLPLTLAEIDWLKGSFMKVCVQVDSEAELVGVYEAAKAAGLEVHMVEDEGRTEFGGVRTKTCCAIGPDEAEKIDPVTGHLKLY